MKILAKIGFENGFADRKWKEGEVVVNVIGNALKEDTAEDLLPCGLSTLLLVMEAESIRACEERVKSVFAEHYPDDTDALWILAVEEDGSPVTEALRRAFRDCFNMEDCQRILTMLTRTYPFVQSHAGSISSVRSMNYLLSADSGCGFHTVTWTFCDFFKSYGLFGEETDDEFAIYVVGDSSDKYEQFSVDNVLNDVSTDDKKNCVIGIDISYFLNEDRQDSFRRFLTALRQNLERNVFIFRVPVLADSTLEKLRCSISDIMELELIRIPPQTELLLHEFANYRFGAKGFTTNYDVWHEYTRRLNREKADGRFYGYKTADKIINEMVWEKLRNQSEAVRMGTTTDEKYITPDDFTPIDEKDLVSVSGFDELKSLVGMEKVEARIREIVAQVKTAKNNAAMERPSLHMRFVGAPGTGKTTVARIVGRIFKEEGILRKGDFFEYEARSLCGEYIGQTAPRTRSICQDAYGSVLFIDEAYSLYSGDSDGKDYGREALSTLIAEIENHRDDMVVIMAGYTDEMEELMKGNTGLRSRIPYKIEFTSYSREQLGDIFMRMARKNFSCESGLEPAVRRYFDSLSNAFLESKEFSNARFVRNLYERTWAKASLRAWSGQAQIVLTAEDFLEASGEKEFSEKLTAKKKLGFL